MSFSIRASPSSRPRPNYLPDVTDLVATLAHHEGQHQLHSSISTPAWNVDPHTSADHLAEATTAVLPQLAQHRKLWRRKSHISSSTWLLVDRKKHLLKSMKTLRRTRNYTVLHGVFLAWRSAPGDQNALAAIQRDLPGWLRLHDHSVAWTFAQLQLVSQEVQLAIRQEDCQYYLAISQRLQHTSSTEGLTGIWRHLCAVLPKNRSKSHPTRYDIDDDLCCHFTALEAGLITTPAMLKKACLERNHQEWLDKPDVTHLSLTELPTLVEIENLCLQQKPRKASGLDGIPSDLCRFGAPAIAPHLHSIVNKALIYGIEPYDYKGGQLCPIFKGKGSPTIAAGYRGILLSNSFAKITHAWARSRLLPTLHARRTLGQLGGLPSQQTTTGIQAVRLHSRIAHARHLSSATLFLDLRAAFHHMLRELVFATSNPLLSNVLATFLSEDDFDVCQIAQDLDALCSSQVDDIPSGLRQLLHDIHCHTWFVLQSASTPDSTCTHTRRGTRPGSPLADIGFNLMMTSLLHEVQQHLLAHPLYVAGSDALGTYVPPIAWMDDVAICLTTTLATSLTPLVRDTIAFVHTAFRKRGLSLNLDKGKSEVVLNFRGPGAVECRTTTFDIGCSPTIVTTNDTHVLSLGVTSSYRHLGVRFAMNLDYEQELISRLGAARQAFAQMQKPIFLNKALPVKVRLMLFQSLILSRLFYGCAAWAELSASSFRTLEASFVKFYRRICNIGYWQESRLTDVDFVASFSIVPFRIFWAKTRLCFLQHLAHQAPTYHKTLLLDEFATRKGWLHEVCEDLRWLSSFITLPFAIPEGRQGWIDAWTALRACTAWPRWIGRAVLKHVEQERIAWEVRYYHDNIKTTLEVHGMKLLPSDFDAPATPAPGHFVCSQCDATFATAQQLALHSFKLHHVRCLESQYVQSDVCPGCLKTFHTSFRVIQHLRYRPNQCWGRIHGIRPPGPPTHIDMPEHLRGVCRLPSVRRHHGPLRPTMLQREIQQVRAELSRVRHEGDLAFAWWDPSQDLSITQPLCAQFDQALHTWLVADDPQPATFHDLQFGVMLHCGLPDLQAARIFIYWIEHDFAHFVLPDDYLHLHSLLEDAHLTLLSDLYPWQLRCQWHSLQRRLECLLSPTRPQHRDEYHPQPRPARIHPISQQYSSLMADELQRRAWRMEVRPTRSCLSSSGPYLIVHLYAGRRREGDFHAHMQMFLKDAPAAVAQSIFVISSDTAIDPSMNVHSDRLWDWLLSAAQARRILGLLLGPPCETWSSARFEHSEPHEPQPQGPHHFGPRPLRHADCCWGLSGLSLRELQQVSVGNCLLLRGIWLCVPVALGGGTVILEHPAPPYQPERPSIFRTGIITLLLRDGWLFRRHTIQQWKFGAAGVKPTTLLYANTDLPHVLPNYTLDDIERPTTALIGRDAQGRFRTAAAKEYPDALSKGFAAAVWSRIDALALTPSCTVDPLTSEFADLSAWVEPGVEHRPDYQPR